MAQRSRVPKFGNWESEENVPYTVYFEKARKGRGGKVVNPNDPEDNSDAFPATASPARAPASRPTAQPEEPIATTDPPTRNENMGRRTANESAPHQRPVSRGSSSNEAYKRPTRPSAGSEHSIERSPLHPHYQARLQGKGSASPSWDGKGSSDVSHGTPGRARRGNARGDDDLDRGAAVPKFGEWDESNPASADGFTHIFNKVREEKQTGATTPSRAAAEASYGHKKQNDDDSVKMCCFSFGRK